MAAAPEWGAGPVGILDGALLAVLGACSLDLVKPGPLGSLGERMGVPCPAGEDVLEGPSKFWMGIGCLTGLAGSRLSAELLGAIRPSGMLGCPGVTGVPREGIPVGAMPVPTLSLLYGFILSKASLGGVGNFIFFHPFASQIWSIYPWNEPSAFASTRDAPMKAMAN